MASTNPHTYPRPQLRRAAWTSLDGAWDFAIDADGRARTPDDVAWGATIQVPFSPETPASGIGDTGFFRACWYRRRFAAPDLAAGRRLVLHFGAVDYRATVWVNGALAGQHEGGYTPFAIDTTDLLVAGEQTVTVRAEDDPHDLAKPRGKQDWHLHPHSIWYPRTTGIWQTVWLEPVPETSIASLRWTSSVERWEIGLDAAIAGAHHADGLSLQVRLTVGERVLADDTCAVVGGEVRRRFALRDPGIEDARRDLLWSPYSPTLIDAELTLRDGDGAALDTVASYTALRSIGADGGRLLLNGRPFIQRLVLDQGYWPDSGLTAPDDDAHRRDVELVRAMGFNGVRKHQKVEDPRFLYWADRLGLLVWAEMPSAYRFTDRAIERLTREWTAVVRRDCSHPCIVAWVPFNESWGVPDLPTSEEQRQYVRALYALTKALDPDRPVIGNDGWEHVAGDILGIHDYDPQPDRLGRRYEGAADPDRLFRQVRPGGRSLGAPGYQYRGQPIMLTELGGIAMSDDRGGDWGYSRAASSDVLAERYEHLLDVVTDLPVLAGFCYTQLTDTYQEANGLLYADRRPKFPLDRMAAATSRPMSAQEELTQEVWRRRRLAAQHREGEAANAPET